MKINRLLYSDWFIYSAYLFVCLFILLQSPLAPFSKSINGVDSSAFIYVAEQIMKGKLVYHDVVDHKGPFLYLINVVALTLFNGNYTGIWIFEILSLFTTMVILHKTLLFFFNKFISSLAVITGILYIVPLLIGGNLTEEWALPYISLALYIILSYFYKREKFTKIDLFLLSFTFVIVLMLRANLVAVWGGFGTALLIKWIFEKKYKELIFNLSYLLLFAIISIIPFFLYFYSKGILDDAIYFVFQFNLFEYGRAIDFLLIRRIYNIIFNNILYLNIVFFIVAVIFLISQKDKYGGFFISYLMTTISCSIGISAEHYFMIYIPLLVVPLAYIYNCILYKFSFKSYLPILIIFLLVNTRHIYNNLQNIKLNYSEKGFGEKVLTLSQMNEIKEIVFNNTKPSDKILVWGLQCSIYLYTQREASSKYPYPLFSSSLVRKHYLSEMENNPPTLFFKGRLLNGEWLDDKIINSFINNKYELIDSNNSGLEIWKLKNMSENK